MGSHSDRTDWPDPPAPVSGAPRGSTNFGVVVGTKVVLVPGDVVVGEELGNVVVEVVDVEPATSVVDVLDVLDVVDVVVVGGGGVRQVDRLTVLSSSVTAPLMAWSRPFTTAPVLSVIEAEARIVPMKLVDVPSVAELPTSQKTLQAWAPFSRTTEADDAVVSVEPA